MNTPYDPIAPFYSLFLDPFFAKIRQDTLSVLKKRFGTGTQVRILEIGCGTGAQSLLLTEAGFRVTGVDLSHGMIREAGKRRQRILGLVRADGRRLPFRSAVFNAVVLQMALHEMPEAGQVAVGEEILRVTAKDGAFFFLDFIPPKRRTFLGVLITLVERAAGEAHYRNGRQFIAQGGIPAFSKRLGLEMVASRVYFKGNIALVVAVKEKGVAG